MNVGRPSKEVTCDLHIRISKDDREKLEFLAKMQGISISECAREVFRKGLR